MTLPEMLCWHGQHNPAHPFAVLAPDHEGEVEAVITWHEVSGAIFRLAAKLREDVSDGLIDGKPPVVGILAFPETLTYVTWVCAIVAAGYAPFPLSPRNSFPAFEHLLKTTNCRYLIGSLPSPDKPASALQQIAVQLVEHIPGLGIIEAPKFDVLYPRLASWPPAAYGSAADVLPTFKPSPSGRDAPLMIIHSSGSTSFPKPIPLSDAAFSNWGRSPWYQDDDFCGTRWGIMSMPMFHIAGLAFGLGWTVCSGTTAVFFKPQETPAMPTPGTVLRAARLGKADYIFTVPSICVEWAQDAEAVAFLSTLKAVRFGGGPLPEEPGHRLVEGGVKLQTAYGMTETGPVFRADSVTMLGGKEWMYAPFMPHLGVKLIDEGNNAYRLVLMETSNFHVAVSNFDAEVRAFDTNDLLEPHPTRAGYWKVIGRADDQIMMSNGEKTNPGPLESIIVSSPHINAAIMFGRARTQAGVLVEPRDPINIHDENEIAKFRNSVWDDIHKANTFAPQHSRIFKEFILVSDPVQKPLLRTPKGTIARNASLQLYADDIERIYEAAARPTQEEWAQPPDSWDDIGIHQFVVRVVNGVMRGDHANASEVNETRDLFEQGCDSLQATYIRAAIANALLEAPRSNGARKIPTVAVPQNLVFLYPSIRNLASFVRNAITGNTTNSKNAQEASLKQMLDMVEQYSKDLPIHHSTAGASGRQEEVVLLTGSTGTLGTYILQQLLVDSRVSHVYALNRPSVSMDVRSRQRVSFEDRGVDLTLLESSKLSLIEGDTTKPDLGLSDSLLKQVKNSLTTIIHNAWRLDFNLSLSSFESHIKGARNLVNLALGCSGPSPAHFIFTSTIGAASNWKENRAVPEEPLDDPAVALGNGYGQSKWVTERVLLAATREREMRTTIWRVGQLSGSTANGAWNTTDWIPIIAKSSVALGGLPASPQGTVDWLPTDKGASAIIDSLYTPCSSDKSKYFNLVHPKPTSWTSVFECMSKELSIPLIPFGDWVSKVEQATSDGTPGAVERIPAIKILDFLRRAAGSSGEVQERTRFETADAVRVSTTLRDLEQLGEADVRKWLGYWNKHGM
ncbi:acetyl-CoA synthetase-like protein, partial [Dacryopinax primogenitus]